MRLSYKKYKWRFDDRCTSSKCALERRKTVPGQHGPTKRAKLSNYGLQQREKQRIRFMYGVNEKQFYNTYKKAGKMKGVTGHNFLFLLESRLDNVAYRMGLSTTRRGARQLVNHGHLLVNGHKVDIPSYICKPGDVIEVRTKSKQLPMVIASLESSSRDVPSYVELDAKKAVAKFAFVPKFEDVPYASLMEPNLVIEFYSR